MSVQRYGYGRASEVDDPLLRQGFAALVDILMASIGIFLLIFVFQEISEETPVVRAQFAGVLVCDTEQDLQFYLHSAPDAPITITQRDMAGQLAKVTPNGGRFLVLLGEICWSDSQRGTVKRIFDTIEEMTLNARPSSVHEFELAPVDHADWSVEAILDIWSQQLTGGASDAAH